MKNTGMVDVTVIIPNYNREELLIRAVDSCMAQRSIPKRILIIDDCSEIAIPESVRINDIVEVVYKEAKTNAADSRNIGIDLADTEFVAFLDSDDFWYPDHLEQHLDTANRDGSDFIFTAFKTYVRNQPSVQPKSFYRDKTLLVDYLSKEQGVVRTSTIFGKSVFFKSHRFDSKLKKHQDWDCAIRISDDIKVSFIQKPTVFIDQDGGDRMSVSSNPCASAYFLNKHSKKLTRSQMIGLVKRITDSMAKKGEIQALHKLLALTKGKIKVGFFGLIYLGACYSFYYFVFRAMSFTRKG